MKRPLDPDPLTVAEDYGEPARSGAVIVYVAVALVVALGIALLLAATSGAAPKAMPYDAAGTDPSAQRGAPQPQAGSRRPVVGGSLAAPVGGARITGTATWYCGAGSPCTRGYGPSDMVAAIDPTTGIEKGARLRVKHGSRSVTVRVVDVCTCPGARVIDLSRLAFSRLASPARGVIPVTLFPAIALPETSTEGTP